MFVTFCNNYVQYIQLIKKVCVCVCVCVCVSVCVRAITSTESTLNTYCLINNHWIKLCFYLCAQYA